ncbi:MAG: NAD(P)H-hydrate dehydratase [Dysgonamonadaceae bacterium]|jgi:NAD(P)H-hydrate epimerase|nr:NAD(P)H-hydrate dehydratase [Dysgonamonadaceae bacterium]
MKIFNISQISEIEKSTINQEPIVSIDLMERASIQFVKSFTKEVSIHRRIFIFAGPGNNGGDALAIARLLAAENYPIKCYLLNTKDNLSEDCKINKSKILSIPSVFFYEIKDRFTPPKIEKDDIIIDGIFGSGLNKPLTGGFAALVKYINSTDAKIYSIDVPSGLFIDDNSQNTKETIVKAYKTFTFQFPKLAFLLPDSGPYAGDWEVLDIGLNPETIIQQDTSFYYLEKQDVSSLLQTRERFAYKNNMGHALIVAGSRGKIGAAILCTKSCLRIGAGLVTGLLPACGENIMQTVFPEAMVIADTENNFISETPDISTYSAIGIGPGIGKNTATEAVLSEILSQCQVPIVLDADALNILSQGKEWLKIIPANSILTPHIGEFDRLVGASTSSFERLQKALDLAAILKSVVVLKGAYTAICTSEREIYFNSTGNPGMATAGSGDVLTGIITGLLAQNYSPLKAAKIGVYIHGLAGNIAAKKHSQESLVAGDIIDSIGIALQTIRQLPDTKEL